MIQLMFFLFQDMNKKLLNLYGNFISESENCGLQMFTKKYDDEFDKSRVYIGNFERSNVNSDFMKNHVDTLVSVLTQS